MASLEGRLFIGKVLIEEFGRLVDEYEPKDGKDILKEIKRRANMVTLKMAAFSKKLGEPPEIEDQITQMECIIKKLEIKQNQV